ncbi:MAG: SDR family oxidoreductase [Longilinea sp.]|nr:SDR family oxidoreductase [Longilinea sp.]
MQLAVVTGGAVRLGRAIALALAQQGYAIGLHAYRSQSASERTAAEIEALGVPVLRLSADLRQPAEVMEMFAAVKSAPWPLGVWVNSAAVMRKADVRQLTVAEWDETFELNLRAAWLCAQQAALLMTDGGAIVNISDAGAGRAWSRYPAYTVSKAALEALTRVLARSLAPQIRVNAVAPGLVLPSEDLPEEEWARLVARLPLQHQTSVEAVTAAVLFLVKSGDITGQTIVVDGGYQLT